MKSMLCVTLAAALLPLLSASNSQADEVPVSGQIVGAVFVDPGEFSINPGGIVIVRGQVTDEFLTGDLAGTIRVTSTFIGNTNTFEGILFGAIDWKDPNSDGGFRGPFLGAVSGFFFDGHWSLHGYGTHQGQTALIDNFGPFSLPQVYEGVILSPNGP
ncbi:MAG: hypothetical protein L0211_17885 [Planctomycetaceae bacterium]|nr:hypothetical protein [Planctomycetaceae bacterium]